MRDNFRKNKKDFSSATHGAGRKATRPICGVHPIIEAIRLGKEIEKIYFQKKRTVFLDSPFSSKFPL